MSSDSKAAVAAAFKTVAATLLAFALGLALLAALEPPATGTVRASAVAASAPAAPCAGTDPDTCSYEWSKKKSRQFRDGKIGTSRKVALPRKVKRMIARKVAARHGRSVRSVLDDDPWWKYPFRASRCLVYLNHYGDCNRANEIQDRVLKNTFKVVVGCGSQAVIGAFTFKRFNITRKGWWGAGLGSLQCLWGRVYDKIAW